MAEDNPQNDALALIMAKLRQLNLAPEGDFDVAAQTISALDSLASTDEQIAKGANDADLLSTISAKLQDTGLAPDGSYNIAAVTTQAIDDLVTARADLSNANSQVAQLTTAAATAQGSPSALATPSDGTGTARKIKPIKRKEGESDPSSAELLDMIRKATTVEVAFVSDGAEIATLPAMTITGESAWQVSPVGLSLAAPIQFGPTSAAERIDAYGLFLDDKLVAYHQRYDPLDIAAGRTISLTGDVVF